MEKLRVSDTDAARIQKLETAITTLEQKAEGIPAQGVAVPDAAGANPTKAEFDALLASLRTAGVIAT